MQETLADIAYKKVEALIVTLKLQPGKVFSEADLCETLEMGRTPVREALQRLVHDRLVIAMPRRGMMVTDINIKEHLKLLETRRVLDKLIATKASQRASEIHREALETIASKMEEAMDVSEIDTFIALDASLDTIIGEACGNQFAVEASNSLHTHCRRFWYAYKEFDDIQISAQLHLNLIEKILAGHEIGAGIASDNIIDYLESFTKKPLSIY